MKFKDYYSILGVDRNAKAGEIKSAYRKMARKYHPDVNKDSKTAEASFKEIQEAYDVLGDVKKRRQYDSLGANYSDGMDFATPSGWSFRTATSEADASASSAGRGGFSEFFDMLFGSGHHPQASSMRPRARSAAWRASQRGADVETTLPVTIEEAYEGATKKVQLTVRATCTACQGNGVIAGSRCAACKGQGVAPQPKKMEIKIPEGIKDGTRLRLPGLGDPAPSAQGTPGDLYAKIQIQPHPVFTLQGANVHVELPVAPWEAVLGAEVEVPTLGGRLTMKLPPGTQNETKMRLKRRGMPSAGGAGDEIVLIKILIPTELTDPERQLFQQLRDISTYRPRVKARSTQ